MTDQDNTIDLKADQPVERQGYYLVAAEIVFSHTEDPNATPNAIRANAVVMSTDGQFAVPQIGRAQQAVQQNFFNRMGGSEKVKVLDVVIITLTKLGDFTKEEFNIPPSPIVGTEEPTVSVARAEEEEEELVGTA